MGTAETVNRSFDRAFSALPEISRFVRDYFSRVGIDGSHLEPIQLAVEEIFTNMVKYTAGTERILIELARPGCELSVSLTDFNVDSFDIRSLPEVDVSLPLESRRPGGLGIHLTKRLMDRIEYRYEDRCGTTTVFRKVE